MIPKLTKNHSNEFYIAWFTFMGYILDCIITIIDLETLDFTTTGHILDCFLTANDGSKTC